MSVPGGSSLDLATAQRFYGVPAASTLDEAVALLKSWGGEEMPPRAYRDRLWGAYVDGDLVVYQTTFTDADFIADHLTSTDDYHAHTVDLGVLFGGEDGPAEEGEDQMSTSHEDPKWTAMEEEMSAAQRLIVVLEKDPAAPERVGNFRVHGPGQWMREALWAATGVVPREPGNSTSEAYRAAVEAAHGDRWDRPLTLVEQMPDWLVTLLASVRKLLSRNSHNRT